MSRRGMPEAIVIINGAQLTSEQSALVRLALLGLRRDLERGGCERTVSHEQCSILLQMIEETRQ